MPTSQPDDVTRLLLAWGAGDEAALAELMPLVQTELKRLARRRLRAERPGHLLQTTAVVNEAYLRLVDARKVQWQSRAHFFGIAARLIRQILVDAARERGCKKRGGGALPVVLDDDLVAGRPPDADLLALDEALVALAEFDPRKSRVVEMRFFGGLTVDETAEVLQVSPETVGRDWRLARAWLRRRLSGEQTDGP